jgi:hypothetical protein
MFKTVVRRLQIPSILTMAIAQVALASIASVSSLMGSINSVAAQQSIPTCKPPSGGEYLLLIISPSTDNQNQLRRVLPSNTSTSVCRYLNDTVTRIGGFAKIDDANRWARFIRDSAGLSAIITTKPADTVASKPPTPKPPTPKPQQATYQPQQLGQGYAVLVDYFNNPEIAKQVQQIVGGDIGFVSYAQRPYLLAVYTTNSREAQTTLQSLSDRGFFTMVVPSRRVMLLRQVVKLQ